MTEGLKLEGREEIKFWRQKREGEREGIELERDGVGTGYIRSTIPIQTFQRNYMTVALPNPFVKQDNSKTKLDVINCLEIALKDLHCLQIGTRRHRVANTFHCFQFYSNRYD